MKRLVCGKEIDLFYRLKKKKNTRPNILYLIKRIQAFSEKISVSSKAYTYKVNIAANYINNKKQSHTDLNLELIAMVKDKMNSGGQDEPRKRPPL